MTAVNFAFPDVFEETMWASTLREVSDSRLWVWDILGPNFKAADAFIWRCECLAPLKASCVCFHSMRGTSSIFTLLWSAGLYKETFYYSLMLFYPHIWGYGGAMAMKTGGGTVICTVALRTLAFSVKVWFLWGQWNSLALQAWKKKERLRPESLVCLVLCQDMTV